MTLTEEFFNITEAELDSFISTQTSRSDCVVTTLKSVCCYFN